MTEIQYIRDLPDTVRKEIAAVLDACHPPNWRSLIRDVIRYDITSYNDEYIYKFAMETLKQEGSPTSALLNDLGRRGKTVGELVTWISRMPGRTPDQQRVLNILTGAPVITQDIKGEVRVNYGQNLRLHCKALGHQPLLFQWFKQRDELRGKTENTLLLQNVSQQDEGFYLCRVANHIGVVFTGWAKVIVNGSQGALYISQQFDFPIITCQSDTMVCAVQGSRVRLYCDGVGRPAPSFQWFKNNAPIEGATFRELAICNATTEDAGQYFCKVYNSAGEISSKLIQVDIERAEVPRPRGSSVQLGQAERVANKVALLIGNRDYQHAQRLGELYHPINDVCDLTGRFLNMNGFKVVSLVNLTLKEMREALQQFCRLLVKDTYAVFYFAGHGFECGGRSFLMPVDATDRYSRNENMATAEVLKAMQETKAKLNIVLLDCCRSEPFRPDAEPEVQNRQLLQGGDVREIKEPNVVLAFGCCSQSSVFECRDEKNGFFAKHLLKNITDEHRNKSIEEVLLGVSLGIHEEDLIDQYTRQRQVVNRITTLVKPMKLWCPVDNSLMNPSTAAAIEQWQSTHEIPNEPVTVFEAEHDRIKVELNFNAELSNVLIVNARSVGDEEFGCTVAFNMGGVVSGCRIERTDFLFGKKCRPSEAALKVKDLQRLTEPLILKLIVVYTVNGERIQKDVRYTMEEKPLYAKLVTRW